MHLIGKVNKCTAIDMPQYKRAGWGLVPHKAFKNVDPFIIAEMKPLPELNREDYK
jgi:hypothetical protein